MKYSVLTYLGLHLEASQVCQSDDLGLAKIEFDRCAKSGLYDVVKIFLDNKVIHSHTNPLIVTHSGGCFGYVRA